jgi:ribosomal protein L24E
VLGGGSRHLFTSKKLLRLSRTGRAPRYTDQLGDIKIDALQSKSVKKHMPKNNEMRFLGSFVCVLFSKKFTSKSIHSGSGKIEV